MKKNRLLALLLAAALSVTTFLPAYAIDAEVEENVIETVEAEQIPEAFVDISEKMASARETSERTDNEETVSTFQTRIGSYGDLFFNYDIFGCGFVKGTKAEISYLLLSYGHSVPYYIIIANEKNEIIDWHEDTLDNDISENYYTLDWYVPYDIPSGEYYIYGMINEEIVDNMTIYVTDSKIPATGLNLDQSKIVLEKGDATALIASLEPFGTTDIPNLTWTSSDPKVAAIEEEASFEKSIKVITAKGYGSCTITAKYGNKFTATCEIYVPDPNLPFKDVAAHKWFYNSVKWAYETGLITGTSDFTFSPDNPMTRGMLVTVLYRAEGRPEVTGTNKFPDVIKGKYYEKGVVWASEADIVSGYTNGKFGPDDSITREQLAKVLYRYAEYKGYDVTASESLSSFKDASSVASYAKRYMEWAVAEGLIKGSSGNLNPKGEATRAEIAAILKRFVERYEPAVG